jgi:predicted PurR-regulated permease PerM
VRFRPRFARAEADFYKVAAATTSLLVIMNENPLIPPREENSIHGRGFFPQLADRLPVEASVPLKGVFTLLVFYTIYFAAPVLIPITVALLLSVLLSPFVDRLKRLGIPRVAGAAVVIVIVFGTISTGLITVAAPAQEWLTKLPESFKKVEAKLRSLKKPLQDFQKATEQIENVTELSDSRRRQKVEIQRPGILEDIFSGTQRAIASIGVTLILTVSLLVSGERFLGKIVGAVSPAEDRQYAVTIIHGIRRDLSYYLAGITLINLSLGVSVGILAYVLGLPNALLWGSIVALLSFAPYIGSLTNMMLLALVGLIQYDTIAQALVLPFIFLALSTFVQSVVVPYVLGARLLLSPIAIFLAILLWGWMWGVIGALLAVPLLVSFKIICGRFQSLKPVAEFLTP